MRILLVEDEPDLGAAIKQTLVRHTYVVDWATDGDEAWNYLDTQWTNYTLGIFDLCPVCQESSCLNVCGAEIILFLC